MTTDFRALCAELVDIIDNYAVGYVAETLTRARAAVADEPAVPELKAPTDEELKKLLYFEFTTSTGHGERVDEIAFARAVLARWGNPAPAPPADGEVAELVEWLRDHAYVLNPSAERKARRICVLLQHQALPGVAVSERLPGPEDWDAEGRSWWFIPASVMPNGTCPCWCLAPAESPRPWFTHWRPANAMPIPQQQESDNG